MRKITLLSLAGVLIPLSLFSNTKLVRAADTTYDIHPLVHDISYGDEMINIPHKVEININGDIDKYTKNEAYDVLAIKGVLASTKEDYSNFKLNISINNDSSNGLFEKLDAYTLSIDEDSIDIIGKDDRSCFYALQSLREIFNQSGNEVRELTINDYSNSLYRGVIEGLYGVPYNNFEIEDMIEFISKYKANTFFYGPRHDSYFRTAWRELLPRDELMMLEEVATYAKSRKVDFYFGLNPVETRSFTMANYEKDYAIFIARFEQAYSIGIRHFFISADDVIGETIEPELHVRFMNDLAAWAKEKGDCGRIVLTPSCYCGSGVDVLGVSFDYLTALRALDETIDIFWTGYDITSNVSTGDFERFYEMIGREPIFWLNWPVNDYYATRIIMSKGEMLDVNYENEDAPFLGLITNPQVKPYMSLPQIYQCLDYAWNYKDFDFNTSHDSSYERIEENEPEALMHVSSYLANATKYLKDRYFEESPILKPLIEEYYMVKEKGGDLTNAKNKIKEELNKTMQDVDTLIANAKNRNLIDELMPYMLAVKDTCIATIKYLELEDIVINKEIDKVRDAIIEASNAYEHIKENKAIVLEYVSCNEVYQPVEVCNAVLTPFLNQLILDLDLDAKLMAGLPTGIVYRGFNGIYSGTLDDMFDNNENTWVMLDGYALNGSFLQVDLEQLTTLTSLKVVYKNQFGESCYFPKVEISTDGYMFQPLANQDGNVLELDLRDNPIEARFIRFSNASGSDLPWWISIAELKINYLNQDDKKITTSGIAGIYEGTYDNMFDGDPSTYCWFNDYPSKDAYIQIDYRKIMTLNNLKVIFKNMYDNSAAFTPCIEYSVDGKTFTKLMDVNSNNAFIELDVPVQFRYLRLTNNTGNTYDIWVSVAEIMLNIDVPKVSYEGFEGIYSGSPLEILDNDDQTYLWFASGAQKDGYVLIELDEVASAKEFKVVFFNGFVAENQPGLTNCYLSDLEVSMDGVTWTTVETGNDDNLISVTRDEAISFKYIRIKNGTSETTPHWVAIASVEYK